MTPAPDFLQITVALGDAAMGTALQARGLPLLGVPELWNLERPGDHATTSAENVWFLVKGEEPLPPRDKRDETTSASTV